MQILRLIMRYYTSIIIMMGSTFKTNLEASPWLYGNILFSHLEWRNRIRIWEYSKIRFWNHRSLTHFGPSTRQNTILFFVRVSTNEMDLYIACIYTIKILPHPFLTYIIQQWIDPENHHVQDQMIAFGWETIILMTVDKSVILHARTVVLEIGYETEVVV